MISRFKKLIIIINFFILILQFSFCNLSAADEKKKQPDVTTKQYRDWSIRCVIIQKKEDCEVFQVIQIKDTNLTITIAYTNFINEENELKEVINIITPLGVNLQKRISLNFHKGIKINLPYLKCEAIGCIILITNNSKDPVDINIFDQIKKAMQKSIYYEIIINGFNRDPVLVKSSLQGFDNALKALNNSKG
jgi:invasion protein IalB|tara:strand:- start:482 stop:1057 length:576 start_codon:yes stop_codon:yes gene_type:complete